MLDILTAVSLLGGFFYIIEKIAEFGEKLCETVSDILRGKKDGPSTPSTPSNPN